MILHRYLVWDISKAFAVILAVLCVLFAGYSVASILSDAVNGLLPALTIFVLAGLKLVIALDVLIPISLYFAVLLTFGRLYGDSEMTAMAALGVRPGQVAQSVVKLALIVALGVAALSLVARPWAYRASHTLTRGAAATLNVNAMEAGTFYTSQQGSQVVFLTHRAGPGAPAQNVFVRRNLGDHTEVIFARLAAALPPVSAGGQRQVYLANPHIYEIDPVNAQNDQIIEADGMTLNPDGTMGGPPPYSPVAAGSRALTRSVFPADFAELQWRLSTPVSTLLLGLLGLPLSRGRPRQGKYAKFGPAIIIYAGYYLLCTSARVWVEHGVIGRFPGIWWGPALLGLLLLGLATAPALGRALRRLRQEPPRPGAAQFAPAAPSRP